MSRASLLVGPPARVLARAVGVLALLVLALTGAALAIFSIQGGTATLSLPNLAELLGLSSLRDSVADLLGAVEADGPLALLSALGGIGAILIGALLVIGALTRQRERLFESAADAEGEEGRISARPRPLASAAAELARGTEGITAATARARLSRRGGRIRVDALHRGQGAEALQGRVDAAVAPLRMPFGADTRVGLSQAGKGNRVE